MVSQDLKVSLGPRDSRASRDSLDRGERPGTGDLRDSLALVVLRDPRAHQEPQDSQDPVGTQARQDLQVHGET